MNAALLMRVATLLMLIKLLNIINYRTAVNWMWVDISKNKQMPQSLLFSNLNVMYQKSPVNNRKIKEVFFPTPPTRIGERNSAYEDKQICLEHSNSIQFICVNCQNKLLCSQCISGSSHMSHDIRNLERARQMLFSQYQQWMVRLSSKSQILDIIHVQFESNKSEINLFSKQYKEKLGLEFEELIHFLKDKFDKLTKEIDGYIRDYIMQMSLNMEKIRAKRKDIEKILQRYDKDSLESFPLTELAHFSFENKHKIAKYLQEADILQLKQKLVEPEWCLNYDIMRDVRNQIDNININFKTSCHYQQSELNNKKLKLSDLGQYQRHQNKQKKHHYNNSNSPFNATYTPKNISKEHKNSKIKQKKSPESTLLKKRKKSTLKMISMPASPAKEVQSTPLITPSRSRKRDFKKK